MNKVYFIGAGPGDPMLLTLQGADALKRVAMVFAPEPFEETFATVLNGKEVVSPFDFDFVELVDKVSTCLENAEVAFLIPGDLTFYAPFQALINHFADRSEVLAGVGVANAASARLKRTLDLPGVCNRAIIVSPKTLGKEEGMPGLDDLAGKGASLLIYMNNLPLVDLCTTLRRGYQADVPITLLHRLGLPGEEIISGHLDTIVAKTSGRDYFNLEDPTGKPALTLVVVGETLDAEVDGSWWDYRREHIWKKRHQVKL
ncbi:SAM-dependent methyltransferase [Geopsychrobacter electrodiphilus]|uniref:SAM-dependent methyltransferase n=1 Tax=Geopsychrobacter electrodiphilus TaxID=225196 RepID=UPI00036696DD|nr:SAM-dependent methyltransferase [Geopsychrobacter electrodiphilus]